MLTTLNPKVSIVLVLIAFVGLEYEASVNASSPFAFFIGVLVSLPLIAAIWTTMKKNWPVYRKFYSQSFHQRDMKAIRKSWRLTWWLVPYTLIVFTSADLFLLFSPQLGTPMAFFWGVFLTVFGYTFFVSQPYYEDVLKARKKK